MILDKFTKDSKNIVFVYTTCVDQKQAREIGYQAIEEKLAISADYWFMNSIYPWQKVIREKNQYTLMFTTIKSKINSLIKFIELEHSYNIPMIAVVNVSMVNHSFYLWANNIFDLEEKYITEEEYYIKKREQSSDYNYGKLK